MSPLVEDLYAIITELTTQKEDLERKNQELEDQIETMVDAINDVRRDLRNAIPE